MRQGRKIDVVWHDDGSADYVSREGDMVDHIAWLHYGTEFGATELILDANPDLAEQGIYLPAGIPITLPHRVPVQIKTTRRKLWD